MIGQDSFEEAPASAPAASTPAHTATASTPASPSWTAAFGSGSGKNKGPGASSPLASGAGRLNNLKAGLSKFDNWLESSLFESPSPSAHARTKSPTPARSPPPSASEATPSSSPLAAPVVIKTAAPSPVAGASNSGGSGGGGLNWGASFESFKQKLTQSGSSLGGGGHDEEEDEHPGAVGFGGGPRRPSPRREAAEEEEEEAAPAVQAEPVVVDEAERARAAASLVQQDFALAEGATVLVMHRGKGLPLAALEAEMRALVKLRWARLHLTPAYWTDGGGLDREDPPNYIAREEPLPALDDQALYIPSADDHGCLLAVQLAAAPQQGNTTSVSRRLLTARPVELDARVKAAVETALGALHYRTGEVKLRIASSAPHLPPSSPLHHAAGSSRLAHDVTVALSFSPLRLVLESQNADTPRGFALDLDASSAAVDGVKVRPLGTQPTALEIEAPLPSGRKRGVVQWEGHASGELFTYASLLRCHPSSSSSSSFNEDTDEEETTDFVPQEPPTATATFSLQFPTTEARDVLATLLRMGLGRATSPPWAEIEGVKASAAAAKTAAALAEAEARTAAVREQLEGERDAARREAERLQAALASEQEAAASLQQQAAAVGAEVQTLKARLEASEMETQRLAAELDEGRARAAQAAEEHEARVGELMGQVEAARAAADQQAAVVVGLKERVGEQEGKRQAAEAALVQAIKGKEALETKCRLLEAEAGQARGEAAQARRKAEGAARELKWALGETGALPNNAPPASPHLQASATAAELARLRVKCGKLEADLEAALQERQAYKDALATTIEALAPKP